MLNTKTCLGIDVGTRDIKLVELRKAGRKYEVVQAVRIPLPQGELTEAVAEALGSYLVESSTLSGNAVCSLPAHQCSIKFAQIPKSKTADQAKIIRFEAESQIPVPLAELTWDFAAYPVKSDGMCPTVIAAAKKSDTAALLAALETARIKAKILTVSSLAAANAISQTVPPEKPVMIVDIGAQWTDICVIEGQRISAARSIRLGSDDLTEAYCRDFNASAEDAEKKKWTYGIAMDARMAAAESGAEVSSVEIWAERMGEEIRRSAVSMAGNGPAARPQSIILVGGSVGLPSLTEGLTRRTGLPVSIGDPWMGMAMTAASSHMLRENPASFAVATGLAKMGLEGKTAINLLPKYVAEERTRKRKELAVLSTLSAAAVLLLIVLLAGGSGYNNKSAQLKDLKKQVEAVRKEIRLANPGLRPAATAVKKTVTDLENMERSSLELLRLLSINLPRSVWITEFSYESGKTVVLKGGALSNSAVADAADVLTQMELFDSVTLDYSNLARGEDSQGYDYQITCTMPSAKGSKGRTGRGSRELSGTNFQTGIVVQ